VAVRPSVREDAAAPPTEGYLAPAEDGINFKGESIDDIPLVYHGADQIHKTLEFEVTTSAKGDRRAKPIDDRDT
jgi:hypothetical protein